MEKLQLDQIALAAPDSPRRRSASVDRLNSPRASKTPQYHPEAFVDHAIKRATMPCSVDCYLCNYWDCAARSETHWKHPICPACGVRTFAPK